MNTQFQNQPPKLIDQRNTTQSQQYPQSNTQQQGKAVKNIQNLQGGNQYTVVVHEEEPKITSSQNYQFSHQYSNSQNSLYGKQPAPNPPAFEDNQTIYFPPPQIPNGLTQPPLLRQSKGQEDPNMMHQSANNQNEVREILWGEQQQANTFWQQKFFLIYEKFEWFGSRFEMLKGEYATLSQQLLTVDSQEDWNELKHHHEQFSQKLEEMFQQLIAVADENQQLINQRLEEDDGVWERRYHELLSNFKALQEKTSILEVENQDFKSSQQGEQQQNYPELLSHYRNLQEEYQKLFNAYNKLQEENDHLKVNSEPNGPSVQDFENMRIEYQRNLQAIQQENEGLKVQCQSFYEQNEQFRQQLHSQAQELSQFQSLDREIRQKSSFIQSLNEELSNWRKKYQELQNQNIDLQAKQNEKTHSTQKYKNQILQFQKDLTNKECQINSLSKKLNDEIQNKEKMVENHHQELVKAVQAQTEKQARLRSTVEKEIKQLQSDYENLLQQSNKTDLTKYQVDSLKKKIEYLEEENTQLSQEMSNKNKQLIGLRNITLQLSTYENVLQQYKILEKDKLQLEAISRKEHNELLQTKKKLAQVDHEFSEYQNLHSSINSKISTSSQMKQIQSDLNAKISQTAKLESEVQKFKQLIEAKQRYIRELQDENSKMITKIQFQERIIETTKQDYQNQVKMLEKRIETLEERNRTTEMEFKKEMIDNYEKEIRQLRLANEEKLKKIRRLDEGVQQLSTKSQFLEKYSATYSNEQQFYQNKLSTLEKSNNELLTKLQLSSNSIEALDQQLTSFKQRQATLRSQVSTLTVQIEEADNLIKSKNIIIVEYEKQVEEFVKKISQLQDRIEAERNQKVQKLKKSQEEIEKLKQKLYNPPTEDRRESFYGGNRYNSRYLSFGTKNPLLSEPKNQEITKLENSLIEQMNEENSKLRAEILEMTKKIHSLETLSRVVPHVQVSPKNSHQKSRSSEYQKDARQTNQFIEERLLKFNERLQSCIHDNQIIAVRDIDLTASQRMAIHEREKRELENKYEKQIKNLQTQIKSLNVQLNELRSQEQNKMNESGLKEFDKYQIMNDHAEKSIQEELEFLKSKLNDQQKTNSALIKLNEHLKKQLQESFQRGSHSTAQYYKLQWKSSQNSLQQEKQKIKKLQEENDKLKRQNIIRDSKVIKDYEIKSMSFEQRIQGLERENTYLRMVKAKTENEKANFHHDIQVYSADIESIKASSNAKIASYEKSNRQLREKCSDMYRELHEVDNSLKWGVMNGISRSVVGNQKSRNNNSRIPA